LELKNYMEDLVKQQLDTVMATNSDMCDCKQCRHDIVAMALTALPARYVVNYKGEMYTRIKAQEQQFAVDILAALTESACIVKTHPHHEKID